ncbi:MAG TPA: hypothetical protein VF163_06740 [Micromonosporaceae bacterium]
MSDEQIESGELTETGELTERFRAFSQTVDPAPSKVLPITLIGLGLLVLVAVVVLIWVI